MWAEHESEQVERRWQELCAAYRDACPAPETSAGFMPKLWGRIEARRRQTRRWGIFAQGFVAAAGVACLLMGALLVRPDVEDLHLDLLAGGPALTEMEDYSE